MLRPRWSSPWRRGPIIRSRSEAENIDPNALLPLSFHTPKKGNNLPLSYNSEDDDLARIEDKKQAAADDIDYFYYTDYKSPVKGKSTPEKLESEKKKLKASYERHRLAQEADAENTREWLQRTEEVAKSTLRNRYALKNQRYYDDSICRTVIIEGSDVRCTLCFALDTADDIDNNDFIKIQIARKQFSDLFRVEFRSEGKWQEEPLRTVRCRYKIRSYLFPTMRAPQEYVKCTSIQPSHDDKTCMFELRHTYASDRGPIFPVRLYLHNTSTK